MRKELKEILCASNLQKFQASKFLVNERDMTKKDNNNNNNNKNNVVSFPTVIQIEIYYIPIIKTLCQVRSGIVIATMYEV